jgi:hypothetical protein
MPSKIPVEKLVGGLLTITAILSLERVASSAAALFF